MEVFWPRWGLGACRRGRIAGISQRPLSPTWAKSVNGLIYYKQYNHYFTAYRGTINLKWPGVFLFMYLFIWEEAVGTLGHYQLILLRGVFLWAEEIVCFDLLSKSEPYDTAMGDHIRPRLWGPVCCKMHRKKRFLVSGFRVNINDHTISFTSWNLPQFDAFSLHVTSELINVHLSLWEHLECHYVLGLQAVFIVVLWHRCQIQVC